MTDTPKYDSPKDEHHIAICGGEAHDYVLYLYEPGQLSGGPRKYLEIAEALQAMRTYALAIADRVHGAELARLRGVEAEFAKMRDGTFATLVARHELERLRGAEVTYLDLVKRMRALIINELREPRARGDQRLADTYAVEVFDEASIALDLPCSDDEGVPFELQSSSAAAKPTMEWDPARQYIVVRSGSEVRQYHPSDTAVAAAYFGERYAAWKARHG